MILVLFYVWEDVRISGSLKFFLSYVSYFSRGQCIQSTECFLFFSFLNSPQGALSASHCSG